MVKRKTIQKRQESCYEWTGKETSVQWKNLTNRPCYIYTSGVLNQLQHGKRVPKILLPLDTTSNWDFSSVDWK